MLELLITTLNTFENVEYLIREVEISRVEDYCILKQSEMKREIEVAELHLTLYVTFAETDGNGQEIRYRGSYNTEIHPGTTAGELRGIIENGVYAAGFVKNPWFPLVVPTEGRANDAESGSAKQAVHAGEEDAEAGVFDAGKALRELKDAFYLNDCHENGRLSYGEFFISMKKTRILNSSGVDVSYSTNTAFVETAVHWRNEGGSEIEITDSFNFSLAADTRPACELIENRIAQLFAVAKEKSSAKPTPAVADTNILLTGDCLVEFFDYYRYASHAQFIFQHLSTYKEGQQVQGVAGGEGDRLRLTLEPMMEGSPHSRPYDDDGLPVKSHVIIDDGKLLKYCGDTRFSSYVGVEPTGGIRNIHISGGTASTDDLRREPYLELISFSSFQVHPITGDIVSEIRLGFYFDGEKTVPVTGGSISGNISRVHDTMRMSAEERQYGYYRGPATVCIRGASISGC